MGFVWLGGVHAGHRWDFRTTAFGIGAGWDRTYIGLVGSDTIDPLARPEFTGGSEPGRMLIYATGGLAQAEMHVAVTAGPIAVSSSGLPSDSRGQTNGFWAANFSATGSTISTGPEPMSRRRR